MNAEDTPQNPPEADGPQAPTGGETPSGGSQDAPAGPGGLRAPVTTG